MPRFTSIQTQLRDGDACAELGPRPAARGFANITRLSGPP